MKNLPILLAFLAALSLSCRKEEPRDPSPPPAEAPAKAHPATAVENPPAGSTGSRVEPSPTPSSPGDAAGTATDAAAAAPGPGAPGHGPMRGSMVRGLQECVDGELAKRKLNEFGDPEGTHYAGGTPLMNEVSGKSTDRVEHVFAKHPDIKTACVRPTP